MKKILLIASIISVLILSACNDPTLEGAPTIPDSLTAETTIQFDLLASNKQIITPSFLLVDAVDGTLGSSAFDGSVGQVGYLTDTSDPRVAMGKTDGWSTTQPISISFKGHALDPDSVYGSFIIAESFDPRGSIDMSKIKPLLAGVDYSLQVSDKTLTVVFLKPLRPSSQYMYAVTNKLKDVKGQAVGTTGSYDLLKSKKPLSGSLLALTSAQQITHAIENILVNIPNSNIDANEIIYSSWFTTASVGEVLISTKGAIAQAINAISNGGHAGMVWRDGANPNQIDLSKEALFTFSDTQLSEKELKFGLTAYTGQVSLPYFLEAKTDKGQWASTTWKSATPSLAKLSYILTHGTVEDKSTIIDQIVPSLISREELANISLPDVQEKLLSGLIGKTLLLSNDMPLDVERLITRFSPIPQIKSIQSVPFIIIIPSSDTCSADVPVTVFQHGINDSKTSIYLLAEGLIGSERCQAIIAIDQPLHGARKFAAELDSTDSFMNLANLPVARDNIRQSVTDAISLRAALGLSLFAKSQGQDIGEPFSRLTLDDDNTQGANLLGISLGGITGIAYTATANKPITTPENERLLFAVNRAHFASTGGGIPYFLMSSARFSDDIKSTLDSKMNCPDMTESCTVNFYRSFAYAAQTVLDTVDPINQIGLISNTTSTFLTLVNDDEVIPNGPTVGDNLVVSSPLGGSVPLLKFGGYQSIGNAEDTAINLSAFYKEGGHYSLIAPIDTSNTQEVITQKMQEQSAEFLFNGAITQIYQELLAE